MNPNRTRRRTQGLRLRDGGVLVMALSVLSVAVEAKKDAVNLGTSGRRQEEFP